MPRVKALSSACVVALVACAWSGRGADAPEAAGLDTFRPLDTQTSGRPLDPATARARMQVPAGFRVTVAAAEPAIRQPIATTQDDRGRLWVAECYSYDGSDFTERRDDRIVILEDADGDGVFESRKIFQSGLNRLTGLVWGFGGVWILTPPTLAFIPDRNGDDRPDGPPLTHLDGWTLKAEHNSVNGLSWGPDGWLYGRHGNKEPSTPGRPGQPQAARITLSCAIWRYHPVRHVLEVVADGTVNPWGHDWDELGQLFMSTSVMEHLWHVVPGSHFKRAAHVPVQSHVYELADPISDHSHRPRRNAVNAAGGDDGGGGHSHVGTTIYLGDRWPEEYRGAALLNNVMGRRVNHERLERDPATGRFVARHGPDFLRANHPWFRGVSLEYGPDGDVWITDWADDGECHDRDGVSRSTGRIYKITWGEPRRVAVDLTRAADAALVAWQTHRNDWYVRHARRLLQERAARGAPMGAVHPALRAQFASATAAAAKLRAMWALHATGGADDRWLAARLRDPEEAVRYWAVRLLIDDAGTASRAGGMLLEAASAETTWLGRMGLASSLPFLEPDARWRLGRLLAAGATPADDPNLIRLLWSGWESAVAANSRPALTLAGTLENSRLREWIGRRIAEAARTAPELRAEIVRRLEGLAPGRAVDLMRGAVAGWEESGLPLAGAELGPLRRFYDSGDVPARRSALQLGARLGDDAALTVLRAEVLDGGAPAEWRRQALAAIAASRPEWGAAFLVAQLAQPALADAAVRALAAVDSPEVAPALLENYGTLGRAARALALDALIARPAGAAALVDALAQGRIAKADVSRAQIRQLAAQPDPALRSRIESLFGTLNASPQAVAARIRKLRYTLKDAAYMQTADTAAGRVLFSQRCAACHTLFGEGGKIGPDLTGAGRKDLDYLLTNILDPNASIAAEWRLAVATLHDGQVVSGALAADRENDLVLQTPGGRVTLDRARVRTVERSATSLMPTGLTDDLTVDQVRDLFGYLMTDASQ